MGNFNEVWDIFVEAFSPNARRNYEEQKKLIEKPHYRLLPKYGKERIESFASLWVLPQFIFIEHLAVKNEYRGRGLGTKIMKEIVSRSDRRIILEVEKPDNDINRRRIRFYKRFGFHLNLYDYVQPPYNPAKKSINFYIMSYPEPLTYNGFTDIRNVLYSKVYNFNIDQAIQNGCENSMN